MNQTARVLLSAEQLGFSIAAPDGPLDILHDISLSVARGESLAIVGASGSGKTTLLGLLAGLDRPTRGRVTLFGRDLTAMDENERARLRRGQVGFVFQSFHLLPSLTALDNVMLALEVAGIKSARNRALEALEQVGLSHRLKHYPRQLSGGEQQRVAIARAFTVRPRLLFADEPTGNLDAQTGSTVADLLFDLNRRHETALVLVTHDMQLAHRCGHIEHMHSGRLVSRPATV
ncbi:MAG TPA: ABC transporter ATP-binding protein [Wenzhouxiangella sp.]|nr:ABC transporter ATP-binding protein [Wenzhouxiangella sp.]